MQPQAKRKRAHPYRLAGHTFVADMSSVRLARFASTVPAALPPRRVEPDPPAGPAAEGPVLRREGLVAGEWREVSLRSGRFGHLIWVSGVGEFSVSADGSDIACRSSVNGVGPDTLLKALLGPPVILALALHDVWCLHCSAVMVANRGIAFLGPSGEGKSTLAARLDAEYGPVIRRISDDILPVENGPERLLALPHFPQIKLPPDQQVPVGTPERLPLAAIYVVNTSQPIASKELQITPLSLSRATRALLRQTVASRLFPPQLLERHLSFCADAAGRVPVRSLSYPKRRPWLPRVCEALLADLETLGLSTGDGTTG